MVNGRAQKKRIKALFKPKVREVPAKTRLFLFVRAAGRCQFDGCNQYLLEHYLTKVEGIFGQMAHIWAFSEGGPRGRRGARERTVHALSNLILLCAHDHKFVDDHPEQYTVEVLRKYKKAHEDRVFVLTDTKPDRHTVAFVLKAKVGGRAVSVSLSEMQEAVAPRYLGPRDVVTADLTTIPDQAGDHYWRAGTEAIRAKACSLKACSLYEQSSESGPVRHVSVFALGPIPLLVLLGTCISDKVPATLYQRHRDTENWKWKGKGDVVTYASRTLRHGSVPASVALLLSLSGRIPVGDLPANVDGRFTVHEITVVGIEPTPRLLGLEESLRAFRDEFMRTMRSLVASHPGLERILLFPAVPAPVAIAVGRDLMPKRDPMLVIYDYDKRAGGFVPTLEVNNQ